MELKNKVALITGASRGIGRAIALRFAKEGASIVVNYFNNDDAAGEVVNKIKKMGRECFSYKADVSKKQLVKNMFCKTISDFGKIDILVNNAAIFIGGKIIDIKEEEWVRVFDVNIKAYFLCAQQAARYMIKQRNGGKIINISSVTGIIAEEEMGPYASTKGAINSFTKVLATELARDKINVNTLAPGYVKTDMNKFYPEGKAERVNKRLPWGRWAEPDEIAGGALFLASEDSVYMTGQIMVMDGGRIMDDTIK